MACAAPGPKAGRLKGAAENRVVALVWADGADSAVVHTIRDVGPADVRTGRAAVRFADETVGDLTHDDEVRAVVVLGEEEHFSAGVDIGEMVEADAPGVVKVVPTVRWSFNAVGNIAKPRIAAVNGFAPGNGCEPARCCEFRYARESALSGQPEIMLEVMPGAGGTRGLTRLLGPTPAEEIVYTGRAYNARECLETGVGAEGC